VQWLISLYKIRMKNILFFIFEEREHEHDYKQKHKKKKKKKKPTNEYGK